MNFNVQIGLGDFLIYVPSGRNTTVTCSVKNSRTQETESLTADGEGAFKNSSFTVNWQRQSQLDIDLKDGVCNVEGYKITGYTIYYYTLNENNVKVTNTINVTGTSVGTTIYSNNGWPVVGIGVFPAYAESGGGGGVVYNTCNVWTYPDENAGSILFNGNQPTQTSGNVSSYTFVQGSSITLTAVAKEGYEFSHWNQGTTTNPWPIGYRYEDVGATATFEAIPQTKGINIYSNGSWGNTGAVKKYENGQWVDLPAHIYRNGHWEDLK